MAAMRLLLLLLVASCGRIAFDPDKADGGVDAKVCAAPAFHDEDADSIDDACDVCPHLADVGQADADGDGVGDACDPRPNTPGDHIVLFDAFAMGTGTWEFPSAQPVLSNDSVIGTGMPQLIFSRPGILTSDRLEYGGHIGTGPAVQHQVIVFESTGFGPPIYFCELNDGPTFSPMFALTYSADGSMYNSIAFANLTQSVDNGDFRLSIDHYGGTGTCRTTWPSTAPDVTAALPAVSPTRYGFGIQGVELRVDWVIQIHSD